MSSLEPKNSLEHIKSFLNGVNPIWAIAVVVLIIYLLEKHEFLAGFVIFGFLMILFFKNNGVLFLSIIADLADYMGGMVPVFGDFLDIYIVILQSIKYGARGFVGLLELIPFMDLLPILSINAGIAEYNRKKQGL